MIFRLSQKLSGKIKAGTLPTLPLDQNPFVDWSATLFLANRIQHILLTNSKSLYSVVMLGKGVADEGDFIERTLRTLGEFTADDGLQIIYRRFIAPSSATVRFSKAVDRSVTGSMNDLVLHATDCLTDGKLSPHEVGFKLNEIPFSSLKYAMPREAFKKMVDGIEG